MIPELTINLPDCHRKLIKGLIPFYGLSEEEVVAFLVMRQLEEMMGSDKIEVLKKYRAIKGWQE